MNHYLGFIISGQGVSSLKWKPNIWPDFSTRIHVETWLNNEAALKGGVKTGLPVVGLIALFGHALTQLQLPVPVKQCWQVKQAVR